jgi:hypothetical protein
MQKLNGLGVEILSLKQEILKPDYPEIVKKALRESAENMVKNKAIDVDLHLALTDEKMKQSDFQSLLLDNPTCLKNKEEMLVDFEKVREQLQEQFNSDDTLMDIESNSLVDTDQIAFSKTFKLDQSWVSKYFGQPADEVGKLMVRNGFVEKFAVLRLSKVLENFLKSDQFTEHKTVECKATRVFYDLEQNYYGIRLMFYMDIEDGEDEEKSTQALDYIRQINEKVVAYMDERTVI